MLLGSASREILIFESFLTLLIRLGTWLNKRKIIESTFINSGVFFTILMALTRMDPRDAKRMGVVTRSPIYYFPDLLFSLLPRFTIYYLSRLIIFLIIIFPDLMFFPMFYPSIHAPFFQPRPLVFFFNYLFFRPFSAHFFQGCNWHVLHEGNTLPPPPEKINPKK